MKNLYFEENTMKKKTDSVNFSTTLNRKTKTLLERFCKARGMKMNHLVEQAVLEYIEDEMDRSIVAKKGTGGTHRLEKKCLKLV